MQEPVGHPFATRQIITYLASLMVCGLCVLGFLLCRLWLRQMEYASAGFSLTTATYLAVRFGLIAAVVWLPANGVLLLMRDITGAICANMCLSIALLALPVISVASQAIQILPVVPR